MECGEGNVVGGWGSGMGCGEVEWGEIKGE